MVIYEKSYLTFWNHILAFIYFSTSNIHPNLLSFPLLFSLLLLLVQIPKIFLILYMKFLPVLRYAAIKRDLLVYQLYYQKLESNIKRYSLKV